MSTVPERLVLYDGVCGLCDRTVQFLLRVDRGQILRFAPLQGDTAAAIRTRHPRLAGIDGIAYLKSANGTEELDVKSTAVLKILKEAGGAWGLLAGFLLVPRTFRDAIYDWVARNRYRWFGRYDSCPLPGAAVRARFLP